MNLNSTQSSICEYWIYRRNDFNFLHRGICTEPVIEIDYLSKNEIQLLTNDPHILGQYQDNFIVIKKGRSELFFGVIMSYKDTQTLQMISFLDYLDFPIHTVGYQQSPQYWSELTHDLLSEKYITNSDVKQNIPNLTITYEPNVTDVQSRYVNDSLEQIKFQEYRQWLFKKHNVIINVTFLHNDKSINIHIMPNDRAQRGINTSLFDVQNVTNIDFTMQTNKLIVYTKTTNSETNVTTYALNGTYYLLNDGTTTTNASDIKRLFPIVEEIVYCDTADVNDTIDTNLTSWEYNEELSFDVRNESQMLDVNSYMIGDPIRLHYGVTTFVDTKISGIKYGELYTTFTCGINRYTLENYLRTSGRW